MVTSSVTSAPLAPARSGHFTLLSRAVKSCAPDTDWSPGLTAADSAASLCAGKGDRHDQDKAHRHPYAGSGENRRLLQGGVRPERGRASPDGLLPLRWLHQPGDSEVPG